MSGSSRVNPGDYYKDTSLLQLDSPIINAEPPKRKLVQSHITPNKIFFTRNHADPPKINYSEYSLSITGAVPTPMIFTWEFLTGGWDPSTTSLSAHKPQRVSSVHLPHHSIEAVLQCAGNRRTDLVKIGSIGPELPWGEQAIGNAIWTGVKLKDLLLSAGLSIQDISKALHVAFVGADYVEKKGKPSFLYGGSIPLEKALSDETLVAFAMNGEPLLPCHGAPIRMVVPGVVGARWVKWLLRINVQNKPSSNHFQANAYKLFPKAVTAATADWTKGIMLHEFNVNSVILSPETGTSVSPGSKVTVKGFAYAGTKKVGRVEITTDGGSNWTQASLSPQTSKWGWVLWKAVIKAPKSRGTKFNVTVRAFDVNANSQPTSPHLVWNFKGYMNNSWHSVPLSTSTSRL